MSREYCRRIKSEYRNIHGLQEINRNVARTSIFFVIALGAPPRVCKPSAGGKKTSPRQNPPAENTPGADCRHTSRARFSRLPHKPLIPWPSPIGDYVPCELFRANYVQPTDFFPKARVLRSPRGRISSARQRGASPCARFRFPSCPSGESFMSAARAANVCLA